MKKHVLVAEFMSYSPTLRSGRALFIVQRYIVLVSEQVIGVPGTHTDLCHDFTQPMAQYLIFYPPSILSKSCLQRRRDDDFNKQFRCSELGFACSTCRHR